MVKVVDAEDGSARSGERKPINPRLVLLAAILLPGFGHVLAGEPRRGLTFQLFMLSLGFITWMLAAPGTSFIGRLAGGLFIYALSIPDAYRIARVHSEVYRVRHGAPEQGSQTL